MMKRVQFGAWLVLLMCVVSGFASHAQQAEPEPPAQTIDASDTAPDDQTIAERITHIFDEIEALSGVTVSVDAGVVTLSGETMSADAAKQANDLAARVEGVVTVIDKTTRDVSVSNRVAPALDRAQKRVRDTIRLLPLIAFALAVFVGIAFFGWVLASWRGLWRHVTPNAFIADLAQTTVRALFFAIGAIAALRLLDATAFLGAFLGAAGVIGLAVGFAVKDTIENYISSIMLSLRQPFRPNDHVVIDGQEGRVIRLTSRATVLMTLQGNHLRIPNAKVFNASILNYSTNPERRFEFELGVDADDDPLAAIETGLKTLRSLDFVLKDPSPVSVIKDVGDSNIVLFFGGWVDQAHSDFGKSRSVALASVKQALEASGFALPEPIYRLRFDAGTPVLPDGSSAAITETVPSRSEQTTPPKPVDHDVAPDTDIERKVDEERSNNNDADLLSEHAPTE